MCGLPEASITCTICRLGQHTGLALQKSELRIHDLTTGDDHNRLAHDCACDVICTAEDVCRELETILHCSVVVGRFSSAREGSRVCMVHRSTFKTSIAIRRLSERVNQVAKSKVAQQVKLRNLGNVRLDNIPATMMTVTFSLDPKRIWHWGTPTACCHTACTKKVVASPTLKPGPLTCQRRTTVI